VRGCVMAELTEPREATTLAESPVQPFRLLLVGAGRIGKAHLRAIARTQAVRLDAIVEPRPEVRADLERTGVRCFRSLSDLIAAPGSDGASRPEGALIAAPTDRHLELVQQVVEAGLSVLCEKPCGLTVEQARACAAAADRSGQFLQIAYWRRYVPELQRLRAQIASGAVGDLLAVHCSQWDQAPPPVGFREASGGIFVDMGVHEFDQLRWLTGQEIASVQAVAARSGLQGPSADSDCGQVIAGLSGGGTVQVTLGRWHPAGDLCRVEVYGTAGTVTRTFLQPENADQVVEDALVAQLAGFAEAARVHASGGAAAGETADGSSSRGASVADAIAALSLASRCKEVASRW
jgi:myo-inositol 2-dehydrogenase / D-chiro-inositol 1-dehydrogenase